LHHSRQEIHRLAEDLSISAYSGTLIQPHRRACRDPFSIECRANGSLVQQGLNGKDVRGLLRMNVEEAKTVAVPQLASLSLLDWRFAASG
jgi:hypothetical protein